MQRHGVSEVCLSNWLRRCAATTLLLTVVPACAGTNEDPANADTSRIVTLSGDLTEFVYELGAGDRIVGVDVTTVFPGEALELPVVGVGRFITAEGVLGVDPTLVLADTQTSPAESLDQMRGAGVAVEVLDVPTTFEAMYDKIEKLGSVLSKPNEARALIARIASEVEAAKTQATDTGLRVAFVYTRGPDVVLLFCQGMSTQPMIEAAGAIDAGAAAGVTGTVQVSAEALVAAAPDVIIVPEEGLDVLGGVSAFLKIPGVAETPAGRNKAILVYPEGDFLTFGPRVAESLTLLIAGLQNFK